jgi:hypothetical protein
MIASSIRMRTFFPAYCVIVTVLAGCTAVESVPPVIRRDSAGIGIVENAVPEWDSANGWRVEPEPFLDIGSRSDDPSQQLYLVGDVIGIGQDLAVLNGGTSQVLRFDLDGVLEARIGRSGMGPQEFTRLTAVYRCARDTLIANDYSRIMTLDAEGRFVRAEPVRPAEGESVVRVRGVSSDCSHFLVSPAVDSNPELGETGRRTVRFSWGSLDGTEREEIGTFPTRAVATRIVEDIPQPVSLPWGADGAWAVGRDRFYYGSTDVPEVSVYDRRTGLSAIVRWSAQSHPITSDDRRLYAARRDWLLEAFPPAAPVIAPLDEYDGVPDMMPVFRSMLVDDAGNLWLRAYPRFVAGRPDLFDRDVPMRYTPPASEEPESWTILDPDGRWLGQVPTPANLVVRSIWRDMVIGVWKDDLDVEHVRAYRLHRSR